MIYKIVFSPTGGTQKVTDIFSEVFGDVKQIDLSSADDDFAKYAFTADDLCFFSFPVYEGRVPVKVADRVRMMKGNKTPAVAIAVYGNRHYNDALIEMGDILAEIGFIPFAGITANAHHSSIVQIAVGRPDADDAKDLTEFAEKIKAKYETGSLTAAKMPGDRPYIERIRKKISPNYPSFDADKCINCMQCRTLCPVKAIDDEDPSILDKGACMTCMRCAYVCPTGARYIDSSKMDGFLQTHMDIFAGRKPNELWM